MRLGPIVFEPSMKDWPLESILLVLAATQTPGEGADFVGEYAYVLLAIGAVLGVVLLVMGISRIMLARAERRLSSCNRPLTDCNGQVRIASVASRVHSDGKAVRNIQKRPTRSRVGLFSYPPTVTGEIVLPPVRPFPSCPFAL